MLLLHHLAQIVGIDIIGEDLQKLVIASIKSIGIPLQILGLHLPNHIVRQVNRGVRARRQKRLPDRLPQSQPQTQPQTSVSTIPNRARRLVAASARIWAHRYVEEAHLALGLTVSL